MSDLIIGVCAWCEALKPEDERDRRENISHGCCERHLADLKAELAARRERQ